MYKKYILKELYKFLLHFSTNKQNNNLFIFL